MPRGADALTPSNRVTAGAQSCYKSTYRMDVRALDLRALVSGSIAVALSSVQTAARQSQPAAPARATPPPAAQAVLDTYCVTCHNQRLRTAGLALDTLDVTRPGANAEVWEKVIAKLRAGSMPPPGRPRPDAATYHAVAAVAGERHRPGVGGQSESRPDHHGPPPQSRRIPQRDSRPVRARPRREIAAARRRHRRRQLRQLRGCPLDFDGAPGALHVGRPPGHAARDGPASGESGDRDDSRFRCT